jgi:hypothetical protein
MVAATDLGESIRSYQDTTGQKIGGFFHEKYWLTNSKKMWAV